MRKTYLATCLAGAFVLAACGGGSDSNTPEPVTDGGGNNGGNPPITETVSFDLNYGATDINERTSFTIEAKSDIEGVSYAWDYTSQPGYSISVNDSLVTVTVGELTQDVAFNISVTASADGYEDAEDTASFSLIEIDRALLPPELTVSDATMTTEGVDSNANGVRDDAERSIYTIYEDNYDNRIFAWALARTLQHQITAIHQDNTDAAIEYATKLGLTTSHCLTEFVDEDTRRTMFSHVQNMMLDTPDRKVSFGEFISNRSEVVVNVSDLTLDDCSTLFDQE
jgi:hypothetical protein